MSSKVDKLYAVDNGHVWTIGELLDAHSFYDERRIPQDVDYPHVRYYCQNSDCVVRQVEIRAKLYGETMPDTLVCPACRKPMQFLAHMHRTVISVRAANKLLGVSSPDDES